MVKARIPETDHGIQGEFNVEVFDIFAKYMRDKGWIETKQMLAAGIQSGHALEIGPGPGIKGLEWLKHTSNTKLTSLDISEDMLRVARKNAEDYGLSDRVTYVLGNATQAIPFEDESFDVAFSNGSLHEWEYPEKVFNELYRVLKPNSMLFVSDLRRDINPLMKLMVKVTTKPKEILPGFITSLNAAYTVDEMVEIMKKTAFKQFRVEKDPMGLSVIAHKG
jgi:ubiquinone/menaquinone biosynthesis C-methylase UbiE